MGLSVLISTAQPGGGASDDVTIIADEIIAYGHVVKATGIYDPQSSSEPAVEHTWTLTPCDALGNPTEPAIVTETVAGAPGAEFEFPGTETLDADRHFIIGLTVVDASGVSKSGPIKTVVVSPYYLAANYKWCCGQYLAVSGGFYPTGPIYIPVTKYQFKLIACDSQGNTIAPGQVDASPLTTGSPNGTYTFSNSPSLPCGQYYKVVLDFYNGASILATEQVIKFFANYPQPTVSGPTTVCGSGTYCVGNITGTGNTYQWVQYIGYPAGAGNTNCITIPYPSTYAGVGVYVTNQYGCSNNEAAAITVNNSYVDPSFWVYASPHNIPSRYKIQATRSVNLPAGVTETWRMEETLTASPFATAAGTGLTNLNWPYNTSTNAFYTTDFFGYDGASNQQYNNAVFGSWAGTGTAGYLVNGEYYRIIHTVTSQGCQSSQSMVVNQSGQVCINCRLADEVTEEETAGSISDDGLMMISPNPSNGNFQVQLLGNVKDAKAELFNMMGERVDAFTMNDNSYSYSPSQQLSHGVYMLRITNNGVQSAKRIVIE